MPQNIGRAIAQASGQSAETMAGLPVRMRSGNNDSFYSLRHLGLTDETAIWITQRIQSESSLGVRCGLSEKGYICTHFIRSSSLVFRGLPVFGSRTDRVLRRIRSCPSVGWHEAIGAPVRSGTNSQILFVKQHSAQPLGRDQEKALGNQVLVTQLLCYLRRRRCYH